MDWKSFVRALSNGLAFLPALLIVLPLSLLLWTLYEVGCLAWRWIRRRTSSDAVVASIQQPGEDLAGVYEEVTSMAMTVQEAPGEPPPEPAPEPEPVPQPPGPIEPAMPLSQERFACECAVQYGGLYSTAQRNKLYQVYLRSLVELAIIRTDRARELKAGESGAEE